MIKTHAVRQLVLEVLDTIERPYTADVVDDVFAAIEHDPAFLERYRVLCSSDLGTHVVNQAIGYGTATALGTTGTKQRPSTKNKLAQSYSLLELPPPPCDATSLRKQAAGAGAQDPEQSAREIDIEHDIACDSTLLPTDREALINARRGQGVFRKRVLQIEAQCRLTGVDDPDHLRASHIMPWGQSSHQQRLDRHNGLMLAPHVDHLFDRGHISFNDDGTLLVANDAIRALLKTWGIDADAPSRAARPFDPKQCIYMDWHRTHLFRSRSAASLTTRLR